MMKDRLTSAGLLLPLLSCEPFACHALPVFEPCHVRLPTHVGTYISYAFTHGHGYTQPHAIFNAIYIQAIMHACIGTCMHMHM